MSYFQFHITLRNGANIFQIKVRDQFDFDFRTGVNVSKQSDYADVPVQRKVCSRVPEQFKHSVYRKLLFNIARIIDGAQVLVRWDKTGSGQDSQGSLIKCLFYNTAQLYRDDVLALPLLDHNYFKFVQTVPRGVSVWWKQESRKCWKNDILTLSQFPNVFICFIQYKV